MDGFWFEVHAPTGLVASDGTTPVGTLHPGERFRASARDEHWVTVAGTNRTIGYVPVAAIRVLSNAPTPPPTTPPPTTPPPTTDGPSADISDDAAAKSNRGIVVAALIAGSLALGVIATLAAVALSGSGDEPSPTTALLPDRTISTEGTMDDVTEFIETEDGRAVFFEGTGTVSLTFNTSGGPATGNLAVAMSGTDADGTEYVVTYTGVLSGTYSPSTALFEGTLAITGDAPLGLEAAIPDVTAWDGGVVVTSDGCANSGKECVFGVTQPDVVFYWEMPLPTDAINPAYLEGIG